MLDFADTLYPIAHKVNGEAEELFAILDTEYRKANPRPQTFMETAAWEKTRMTFLDSQVMRDFVLELRTEL
jgi:hypothetical protein